MVRRGSVRGWRGSLTVCLALAIFVVAAPRAFAAAVHGTATDASGAPLAHMPVTLKDSVGNSKTANTSARGQYAISVAGLTPPFMVQAGTSPALFGMAPKAGVANIDVYSDLVLGMIYKAEGTTTAAAFALPLPLPTQGQVQLVSALVEKSLLKWLVANKIKPAKFNLLSTPFTANGKGFDKILTETSVLNFDETIHIFDGTTTQASDYTADSGTATVDVATTTSAGTVSSSASASTVVPITAAETAALNGVNALLAQIQSLVKTKGLALADKDIGAIMTLDYLNEGEDLTIGSAEIATFLRGITINSFAVSKVISFDIGSADFVDAVATINATYKGVSTTNKLHMVFECDSTGANCKFYGNQQIAPTEKAVQVEMRTESDLQSGIPTNKIEPDINVDIRPPQGTVSSITITGGSGLFNDTTVPFSGTSEKIFEPTAKTTLPFFQDDYFLTAMDTTVPAGTVFTIAVTPTGMSPVNYNAVTTGVTGEPINLISPSLTADHSLASAHLGKALPLTWGLPLSYPVAEIKIGGYVDDCLGTQLEVKGNQKFLATTATIGSLTFPTAIPNDSHPIKVATFNLQIDGPNGESAIVIYQYGSCF